MKHIAAFIALAITAALLTGCSLSSPPLFEKYDPDGVPIMEKRYRAVLVPDHLPRLDKSAYSKNNSDGPHFLLSEDQRAVKNEYGAPDYISDSYESQLKDDVKEWLYWEEGLVFQFVRRNLVYFGPITDKERVLVIYGYPDDAHTYQLGMKQQRENFYYYSTFGSTQYNFQFINGKFIDRNFVR